MTERALPFAEAYGVAAERDQKEGSGYHYRRLVDRAREAFRRQTSQSLLYWNWLRVQGVVGNRPDQQLFRRQLINVAAPPPEWELD